MLIDIKFIQGLAAINIYIKNNFEFIMLPIELKAPVIYPEQLNITTLMSFQGVPTAGDSSQWN